MLGNLQASKTVFFMCDMQERFRPSISYFSEIAEVAKRLIECGKLLDIPLVVTEQYPKGLGNTITELDISHSALKVEKTKFSMMLPEVEAKLQEIKPEHIVLFGIEAHVCIQQTVIDILQKSKSILGYDVTVHLIVDATSSRSQMDRLFAYERFRQAGVILTTSEALLLQLIGDKDHPKFKQIQAIIKNSAPTSGLVTSVLAHKL